jgi:D-glycero-D-manno-heptose 1,7-bisphosphate phosphatase
MRFLFSQPLNTGSRPAIFLDRDGVINQRIVGDYVREWKQFRFVRGIRNILAKLSILGLPIIVISNQPAIGKGLPNESTLAAITQRFVCELAKSSARIDAVYYCPHTCRDACGCRKPQTGLLLQAAEDWKVDLARSVVIGDSVIDIEAAHRARCQWQK